VSWTFTILGPPATKGSTRSFINPRTQKVVTVADAKRLPEWTQAAGWAARAARLPVIQRPEAVRVSALFEFQKPASAKRRDFPTVKPDSDKLVRALLDALTGIAYEDDAQVVDVIVTKRYGAESKTTVTVQRVC
jgi:crossover junction endodeoxyribonuclease RusA